MRRLFSADIISTAAFPALVSSQHHRGCTELLGISLTSKRHLASTLHGDASLWQSGVAPGGGAGGGTTTGTSGKKLMSLATHSPRHRRGAATSVEGRAPPGVLTTITGGGPTALHSLSQFTEPIKRIILIRNGRSVANDDVSTYVTTPDWRIPLVEEGKRECVHVGRQLAELVGDEPIYFYYSPYIRSRQSLRYVLEGYDEGRQACVKHCDWWAAGDDVVLGEEDPNSSVGICPNAAPPTTTAATAQGAHAPEGATTTVMKPPPSTVITPDQLSDASLVLRSSTRIIGVREDVRLRDGDIGRYATTAELLYHLEERERYGKFFYRFPHGESGADVCDRITSFLDAFQRERVEFPMDTNVVIITHGLTMRMFIKRWFHLTVDTFHRMASPPFGTLCALTRLHHKSCFRLDESCIEAMQLPLSLNENNGYKYRNKRLLGSMSSGAPYL